MFKYNISTIDAFILATLMKNNEKIKPVNSSSVF